MSNISEPLISVIMPVYNAEKYLSQAIFSILNQTYQNFEFLIINDGSIDSSENIIQSFSDKRIKYIKNDKNINIVKTLNKGVQLAKGEYIARMDADDISLPFRLEHQLQFLQENSCDLIGSAIRIFGEEISDYIYYSPKTSIECEIAMLFLSPIVHPTLFARASLLKSYSYNIDDLYCEDYGLWVRLVQKGYKIGNTARVCLNYRRSPNQITFKYSTISSQKFVNIAMKYGEEEFNINKNIIKRLNDSTSVIGKSVDILINDLKIILERLNYENIKPSFKKTFIFDRVINKYLDNLNFIDYIRLKFHFREYISFGIYFNYKIKKLLDLFHLKKIFGFIKRSIYNKIVSYAKI